MHQGEPRYVSALGPTDTPEGWRAGKARGGVLIDVASKEVVAAELPMPHSPRLYDGQLYVLLSATGELAQVDLDTGRYEVVSALDGFVRGMARRGDYLFVGLSKLRSNRSGFADLPIAQRAQHCGVTILHLPSGRVVGQLIYQSSVEELYDIKVLPGLRRPNVLNHTGTEHRSALTTPQQDYWLRESEERTTQDTPT